MKQTSNYQLNQWEKTDRILMEDFNGDNAKVDAALKALDTNVNAAAVALTKCGNCQIYTTSYIGTGTYDSENPCSLTFSKPVAAIIICSNSVHGFASWGGSIRSVYTTVTLSCFTSWSEDRKTITWYSKNTARDQLNEGGVTHFVTAFLQADSE